MKRLHYAWTVALLVPLEEEFGRSRASISAAVAVNRMLVAAAE